MTSFPRPVLAWLFDFGGTLDADGLPWFDRFVALYRGAGVTTPEPVLRRAFDEAERRLQQADAVRHTTLRDLVREHVAIQTGHAGLAGNGLARTVADGFTRDAEAAIERSKRLLAGLRARRRVALVSNFHGNLREVCESAGLLPLFDTILDSAVVGAAKPDPRIFRDALGQLGVEPREAVMVGDNFARDIAPAKALGMHTVWVAPAARPLPDPSYTGDRVAGVAELEGSL